MGKRPEILRIVATVLDFSQEERGKTGLDGNAAGWLAGILGQQRSRQMSTSQAPVDQSIARAFINFLEEESSVRSPVPPLPLVVQPHLVSHLWHRRTELVPHPWHRRTEHL